LKKHHILGRRHKSEYPRQKKREQERRHR
jgi:hypothetical protein